MSSDITRLTLTGVAAAIRRKKLSSVEVTRACIAEAERVQPRINCFIALEADEALKAAKRADLALRRGAKLGALHGVPLAHKDMYYRAGMISSGGSKILRDYRPSVTATVVERLYGAGAVWLGRLNMAEFAANPTGHNEHWGHCRNPWHPDHITGGSSSGSGAALAARTCFGSLGSDTGGSVRGPAAFCGVTGLKPTYGRVSRFGILPRAWSLDCVGPLARTAADCARLLRVIAGEDARDATSAAEPVPDYERDLKRAIKGLRIGVPTAYFYDGATKEVKAAMRASLDVFRSLGARVIEVTPPDVQRLLALGTLINQSEASAIHSRWMQTRPQDYSAVFRGRIEAGFFVPATRYLEAVMLRSRLLDEFVQAVFAKVDLLHTPVTPAPAPTIAATDAKTAGDVLRLLGAITRNMRPLSYLGIPAASVPAGFSKGGLPLSMQLAGRPFSEALILRAAHAYQSVTDWHTRVPPLCSD